MEVVWTNKQISMLIQLYHQHSILWDPSHNCYKNKLKKNEAWVEIAAMLQIPQKEAETKMHILRSQFSREKKKMKTPRKKEWLWFESLQFLLYGARSSRTSDTTGIIDGSGLMEPKISPLSEPPTPSPLPAPTPPPASPSPPPQSRSKKRKCDDSLNDANKIIRSNKKMEESKDEFEVYAQYVASELKNVKNERTVLQAKYHINNILLQARMGTFDSDCFGGSAGGFHSQDPLD